MNRQNKLRKFLCVVLAVLCLLTAGCRKTEPEQAIPEQTQPTQSQPEQTQPAEPAATEPAPVRPELAVTSEEEQGDMVLVTTSYCTVAYPFAFSDMVSITAIPEEDKLVFAAKLGEEEVPVFALYFGGQAPISLGTLQIPETGETLSVAAELMQLPENMEQEQTSFYAVQEIFNDVANSLGENQNFTFAQ